VSLFTYSTGGYQLHLFLTDLQLARIHQICQTLKENNWIFISSVIFIEDPAKTTHLYPMIKTSFRKGNITKWVFVDNLGKLTTINED
jgi:hypothetical protein